MAEYFRTAHALDCLPGQSHSAASTPTVVTSAAAAAAAYGHTQNGLVLQTPSIVGGAISTPTTRAIFLLQSTDVLHRPDLFDEQISSAFDELIGAPDSCLLGSSLLTRPAPPRTSASASAAAAGQAAGGRTNMTGGTRTTKAQIAHAQTQASTTTTTATMGDETIDQNELRNVLQGILRPASTFVLSTSAPPHQPVTARGISSTAAAAAAAASQPIQFSSNSRVGTDFSLDSVNEIHGMLMNEAIASAAVESHATPAAAPPASTSAAANTALKTPRSSITTNAPSAAPASTTNPSSQSIPFGVFRQSILDAARFKSIYNQIAELVLSMSIPPSPSSSSFSLSASTPAARLALLSTSHITAADGIELLRMLARGSTDATSSPSPSPSPSSVLPSLLPDVAAVQSILTRLNLSPSPPSGLNPDARLLASAVVDAIVHAHIRSVCAARRAERDERMRHAIRRAAERARKESNGTALDPSIAAVYAAAFHNNPARTNEITQYEDVEIIEYS